MVNGLTGPAAIALTVNAVNPSQTGPTAGEFGNDSGTDGFAVDWAGLAAAVEQLYT